MSAPEVKMAGAANSQAGEEAEDRRQKPFRDAQVPLCRPDECQAGNEVTGPHPETLWCREDVREGWDKERKDSILYIICFRIIGEHLC